MVLGSKDFLAKLKMCSDLGGKNVKNKRNCNHYKI